MKKEFISYLLIHVAVVLFGFTAILGAVIELPALSLVWWRVLIASASLSFLVGGFRFVASMPRITLFRLVLIGSIIAIHWVTFFASVKLAGASICLVCMATSCLFLTIIDPILFKKPFNVFDFSMAVLIVPGMVLVVQGLPQTRMLGVLAGLCSALLAAIFSSLNKKYVSTVNIWQLSWVEMVSAFCTLSVILFVYHQYIESIAWWPSRWDWIYLLILGILCTTIALAMSLFALKHISTFALNLVLNLEPVYGIILAVLILGEDRNLNSKFYIGASLILFAVLVYPPLKKKFTHVVS